MTAKSFEEREREEAQQKRSDTGLDTIKAAGLSIEPIDDLTHLVVGRFVYHAGTGHWKDKQSPRHGYSVLALIEEAKAKPVPRSEDEGSGPS